MYWALYCIHYTYWAQKIRLSWQQSLLHECVVWRRRDVAGKSALLVHSLTVHMIVALSIMVIEVIDGV